MVKERDIFEDLKNAIRNFDEEAAKAAAVKAVNDKLDLMKGIKEMSNTMQEIGNKFHSGELYLPHVVLAADAMMAATKIFEDHLPKEVLAKYRKGTIVMGSVEGDLHDVGLNVIAMTLTAAGYEVHNLGKDITVNRFIEKAKEFNADIIGASALLTVTRYKQKDLVEEVKRLNLPFRIIVGGGPVTREWARQIKADGFGEDYNEALDVVEKIMELKKKETK